MQAGGDKQHHMTVPQPQPAVPPPQRPRFQFSLRTLLLLFVLLGSSLAVFGAWGIVVFGLVVGLAVYVHNVESPSSLAYLVLLVLCLMCLIGLLLPDFESPHQAGRRAQCASNLYQIAAALNAYHQANGRFPPAYIADKSGKPMHSWRVLILPYLELDSLYKAYDFSQPWDGPKNKGLSATPLPMYSCPSDPSTRTANWTQTSYVAVVGRSAAWPGRKSRRAPVDFPGGTSNTIMVVEVANSGIAWAEPRDLSLDTLGAADDKSPAPALTSDHGRREEFFFTYDRVSGAHVAMADGSVQFLWTTGRSNEDLRKILEIGACGDGCRGAVFDVGRRINWPNIAALAVWLLSVGTLLTHAVRSRKRSSVTAAPPSH